MQPGAGHRARQGTKLEVAPERPGSCSQARHVHSGSRTGTGAALSGRAGWSGRVRRYSAGPAAWRVHGLHRRQDERGRLSLLAVRLQEHVSP